MKKTYVKPEIVFEDFSLCNSIATNCELVIDTQSRGTCGQPIEGLPGQFLFIDTVEACNRPIPDEALDGFCYHIPMGGPNIFNS